MSLILKQNFCFDVNGVNGRFDTTKMVTLYLDMLSGGLERRPVAAPEPPYSPVIVEALVRPGNDLGSGGRLDNHSRVHGLGGVVYRVRLCCFWCVVIVDQEAEGILAHRRGGRFLIDFGGK